MATKAENIMYIKNLIADALIDLMRKKGLGRFTVTELTERAGVGRATYFRHFSSKEDVLIFKLRYIWNKRLESECFPQSDVYKMSLWFFTYCDENKELLTLIHNSGLDSVLIKACLDITMPPAERSVLSDADLFNRAYYSYGMVGIMIQSVKSGFKYSPEELSDIYAANQ